MMNQKTGYMTRHCMRKFCLASCFLIGNTCYPMLPEAYYDRADRYGSDTGDEISKHFAILLRISHTYKPNLGYPTAELAETIDREARLVINGLRTGVGPLLFGREGAIIRADLRTGFPAGLYALCLAAQKENHGCFAPRMPRVMHAILSGLDPRERHDILLSMCHDTVIAELLPVVIATQAEFATAPLWTMPEETDADSNLARDPTPRRVATPHLIDRHAERLNNEVNEIAVTVGNILARELHEQQILLAQHKNVRERLANLSQLTLEIVSELSQTNASKTLEQLTLFTDIVELAMAQTEHVLTPATPNSNPDQ